MPRHCNRLGDETLSLATMGRVLPIECRTEFHTGIDRGGCYPAVRSIHLPEMFDRVEDRQQCGKPMALKRGRTQVSRRTEAFQQGGGGIEPSHYVPVKIAGNRRCGIGLRCIADEDAVTSVPTAQHKMSPALASSLRDYVATAQNPVDRGSTI